MSKTGDNLVIFLTVSFIFVVAFIHENCFALRVCINIDSLISQ